MKRYTPKEVMQCSPIVPVVEVESVAQGQLLAAALIEGGIPLLEITLRTPVAVDVIRDLSQSIPEAVIGAGTVSSVEKLHQVIDAGAAFAISPGCTVELLREAKRHDFPLLPGVATGSEIMQGLEEGYTEFKLFPAEIAGGIGALQAFFGPFGDVTFCPTGGVNGSNFLDYLALPNVACVGGSWIVPKAEIKAEKFDEITSKVSAAMRQIKIGNE